MPANEFDEIEAALAPGGAPAVFDLLIRRFAEEKQYGRMFDARLMQQRHELGLPLLVSGSLDQLAEPLRRRYEDAMRNAARDAGQLYLSAGDIARAWPYFRAVGEAAPVANAIEQITKVESTEGIEPVLEIALHERVNPRKGFELLLSHHGICRAITLFDQYPDPATREHCLGLLVHHIHSELVDRLKRAIEQNEGSAPETAFVPDLLSDRDWLFGEYDSYIDTSHLISVLRYSLESNDRQTQSLAVELAEYGRHLGSMYHQAGEPPLENIYVDHGTFLRAMLGERVDEAVAHFRNKLPHYDPDQIGTYPAQVVVRLLLRLDRCAEAVEVFRTYLQDTPPAYLSCPSLLELCQMAGDLKSLKQAARDQGDLLTYAAAAIGESR